MSMNEVDWEQIVDTDKIVTGTGSGPKVGSGGMPKYRHATYWEWSIKYWPEAGGSQGYVHVPDIGWCIDVDDDMPHEIWVALLHEVDALTC